MTEFNEMQAVKRRFFAMRNGVVADALRKGGSKFRIIFGLNMPQISEIAAEAGTDRDLAEALWANRTTRESMLLAPMIFPLSEMTADKAVEMAGDIDDVEIADNYVLRVVRKIPYREAVIARLWNSDKAISRYMALRAVYADVETDSRRAVDMAEMEMARREPLTFNLARMVASDAAWFASVQSDEDL